MAEINPDKLIPYLDAYKEYLDRETDGKKGRLLSNNQEDYKRRVAERAMRALGYSNWTEELIGKGSISESAVKAVQKNQNLVGRFQVTVFSNKVREDVATSERLLFDLYHERKEEECFERICSLVGRKYDLLAYLYFILDSNRYLPLRPSIFDNIFRKLDITLQLSDKCSWDNYQEFLDTVAKVRDVMKDYFNVDDIDLLDAHSFLWTVKSEGLEVDNEDGGSSGEISSEEEKLVFHREHGEGHIIKVSETKVYVDFGGKVLIFEYPEAFDKGYLT